MTKDEIFNNCLKELENSRFNTILKSKTYLQSAYSNKKILNLANKLGELNIEFAKTDSNDIYEEIKKTKIELITALGENGYDINKIIPKFNCEKCQDKGILNDNKICDCLKKMYLENLLTYSQTNLINQPILDKIDLTKYFDVDDKAFLINALKKFENNQTKINTILFTGETGTGKTYIAKSFLKTLILQNKLGLFYDINSLNQQFLNAHLNFEARDKILYDIYNCDVLIIDDLGSENTFKNVTREYLLTILNDRQSQNKITLFTTNLTLNDIKTKYTERFFSRLMDKEISLKFNFIGKDLRLS